MLLNDALGRRSADGAVNPGGLDLAGPIGVNISRGGRSRLGGIAAFMEFPKKIVLDLILEDRG
jgi:hypothetical protein